jgi:tripartite-type tricarboxylate transporter receptor subunit TctC
MPHAHATQAANARVVGQKLAESCGQNLIIDNWPGGNTIIGTEALAKSTPVGYIILMTTNTSVITPSLLPRLPYDPIREFAPVNTVYSSGFVPAIKGANIKLDP